MSTIRLKHFDLNLLVALDALLEEKNVTHAGERVYLSQPAMSAALHKLRAYFGDQLLVRVGRDLELTPRGLSLIEPVREMLRHAEVVLGTHPIFDPARSQRSFTIMLPDFVVPWLVPALVKQLLVQAPGIRLRFEGWTAMGPGRMLNGEIDLFATLDLHSILGEHVEDTFRGVHLRPVRWQCVVSKDHPEVRTSLTREQFLRLPHIYAHPHGDARAAKETARKQLGIELDIRVTADNVLKIPFMVPGTPLLALLPETLAKQLTKCLPIRAFELPEGILPQRNIDLYWHRRNEADAGHAWMRSVMIDAAANL